MKKIVTKFVLVSASVFIATSAMAQTDTTKTPTPDTTKTPVPDTTHVPKDTTTITSLQMNKANMVASQLGNFTQAFYTVTNKKLLSAKQYDLKTEEEHEA